MSNPFRGRGFALLRVAISVGLVALLVRVAGIRQITGALQHADWRWLAVAMLAVAGALTIQTIQWHSLLLASGLERSLERTLRLILIGSLFNVALPTSIGGDVVRAAMVAHDPSERVAGAASVALQRLLNFPGMMAVMGIALIIDLNDPAGILARYLGFFAIATGLVLVALTLSPAASWAASRLMWERLGPIRVVGQVIQQMGRLRGRRRVLVGALIRGVGFWMCAAFNQWALMRSVGVEVDLVYGSLIATLVTALALLPISVNGYGVREGAFTVLLLAHHLGGPGQAVMVGFLIAAQSLLLAVFGLVAWLAERRQSSLVVQAEVNAT